MRQGYSPMEELLTLRKLKRQFPNSPNLSLQFSLLVILPKSLFFGYAINLDSCIGFTGVSNKESSTLRHALITKVNNAIPISFFIININFKFYNFLFIQCIRSLLVAYQLTICYVSIFQYSEHSQELCPTIYCTVCLG